MKRKSTVLLLSLVLLMTLVLSACGAAGNTNLTPSEPNVPDNEPETESSVPIETEPNIQNEEGTRRLKMTLDGNEVVYASLASGTATEEFLTHLPLTLNMTDYINREKHAPLSFSISEENLLNIQKEYEIGDIIYYPPGPTFAMYYAHDGNIISAGFELIARLDGSSIDKLATYPNAVEVTVELGE